MILANLISAIEDPHLPVIWVDESCPIEVWERLSNALKADGYTVIDLAECGSPDSHNSLLECFSRVAGWLPESCPNLNALKDSLLTLPDPPSRGWVVLFREAGALRQSDEETFEDLLEIVSTVHDIKLKTKDLSFKLAVSS